VWACWNSAGTAEKLRFLTLWGPEPMYRVIKKASKLRHILLFWFFIRCWLLVNQKCDMFFLKLPFSVRHIYFRKEGEGGGHIQWLKNFYRPRDNFKILGPPWSNIYNCWHTTHELATHCTQMCRSFTQCVAYLPKGYVSYFSSIWPWFICLRCLLPPPLPHFLNKEMMT
jgi:hypothetical protein